MYTKPLLRAVTLLALFFALAPRHPIIAQYLNVRVSGAASTRPEEVTIAIDPTNPNNLAAGANINFYYYSTDGGMNWIEGRLVSTLGVWGDPCVIFDGEGRLYFGHLSNPPSGSWIDRIVVQRSLDGGKTWNDGAGVGLNPPKQQDKEWLAADITNSPFHGNIYVAWTEFDAYGSANANDSTRILFSRSTDHGLTWSTPVRVSERGGNSLDDDNTVEGAVPAVGPNGEIYLSWAGPLGIVFDKSLDGGVTFGHDAVVTTQPGGWNFAVTGISRCNGLPITACDVSNSPYRGTVYILWSDQRNGTEDTDVFLIKSSDGGESWSAVKRVNPDATTRQQFFPWLAIDPATGYLFVVYYDRSMTTGDDTEVFVAKSTDGGDTFTAFKISDSLFTPSPDIFFGDYINIAAWHGRVRPIWMRMDEGRLSVWTAIIEDTVTAIAGGREMPVEDFTVLQNFPNPFNPSTEIKFSLPKQTPVTITIFNTLGAVIRTIVDETIAAGVHTVRWDGTNSQNQMVASGVYIYRIRAGRAVLAKKMMLHR